MTKLLSQLLEAKEPQFHQTIQRLEFASGYNRHDIRMCENLIVHTRDKIKTLQLDPDDTTNQELYLALLAKLTADETHLVKRLRTLAASNITAEGNISDGIAYSVENIARGNTSFGLKKSVVKRWLSNNPPKKTMKILGYRSVPSMIKHEPIPLLVAAAIKLEPSSWVKSYLESARKSSARDCEDKMISVYCPNKARWSEFCSEIIDNKRQTVIINKELAAIIVLPLKDNQPPIGLTLATLAIGLNGLNTILSFGSYLKLSQVTSDFGHRLELAIKDDPKLGFSELNTDLSWETIQRFFHHMAGSIEDFLEENINIEEIISWQPIEAMLSKIEPKLDFWHDTAHLARHDGQSSVSFNILDVAMNLCNKRLFNQHLHYHQQRALWQEFILRYIRPELLKEAIDQELQPKLATEFAYS